jgi:hypothetical protein
LPTDLIVQRDADERARSFSQGKPVTPRGVLYVSPLEYYYAFDIEGETLLVSPFDSRIFPRDDLKTEFEPPQRVSAENPPNQEEQAPQSSFPDAQIVSGVPDYDQRPWLLNSCGPTAAACLLGYWDAQSYEDFLEGEGTSDDVTHLIEELCDAMGWDPATGVYYSQVPVGLRQVVEDRGYSFETSSLYRVVSIDTVKREIVEGRPLIYGSQENPWKCGHYVVTVGYEGDFIIVHDNWWSTPVDYFVNWDALGHTDDMMTTLVPEGHVGPSSESLPSDVGGGGGGCFLRTVTQAQ